MPLGNNRILGDNKITNPVTRPHRVGIGNWPTTPAEPRTATIDALFGHLADNGYEGVEFGHEAYQRYFPDVSLPVLAKKAQAALDKHGLVNFGATLHPGDDVMRQLNWIDQYHTTLDFISDVGGQYASYQVFLHPDYLNTGGDYREDARYLQWCAQRVAELRQLTWDHGLNFYLEVHVDRITEDPAALSRILEMCTCELNGDFSHFIARGYLKGKHIDNARKLMGHTHVRMARTYGDLSADVPDPKQDWAERGVTWSMFQFMMPALAGGISSRAIIGETGPMHLVKDTLTLDAKLVPLYRAMARYADASAQGIDLKVESPDDLKPWG